MHKSIISNYSSTIKNNKIYKTLAKLAFISLLILLRFTNVEYIVLQSRSMLIFLGQPPAAILSVVY